MKKTLFTIISIFSFTLVFAIPEKPVPARLVNDFASVFSQQEVYNLENKLVDFSNRTSTQIVVVTLNSLDGMPSSMAAQKIGESWGVGGSEFDNGLVILFKPKTSDSKGEVSIQTGRGLEAVIPDAICKRIVENELIPKFRQNDIYGGVNAGIDVLMSLSLKEFTAQEYDKKAGRKGKFTGLVILLIIILAFSGIFSSSNRVRRSSIGTGNLPLWLILSMMGSGSNKHSGSFGNFSSGGGSFGGGGGGFGGFGGGSFGGGGASGSW
jgi:uncharacterized protein